MALVVQKKIEAKFDLPPNTFIASVSRPRRAVDIDRTGRAVDRDRIRRGRAVDRDPGDGDEHDTSSDKNCPLYDPAHPEPSPREFAPSRMLLTFCFPTQRSLAVPSIARTFPQRQGCSLGFQICPFTARISLPGIFQQWNSKFRKTHGIHVDHGPWKMTEKQAKELGRGKLLMTLASICERDEHKYE